MPQSELARRESAVRRKAARVGLVVNKNPSRNQIMPNYGGFMLVDGESNSVVAGAAQNAYELTINEIEAELRYWTALSDDRPNRAA